MLTSAVLKWVILGGIAGLILGFMLGLALANELWRQTLETKDAVIAGLAEKLARANGARRKVRTRG